MTMSIPKLEFPPFHLPAEAEALRVEIRAFLKETLPRFKTEDRFASWNTRSAGFSKALGKKGWIGITWPKQYGGSEEQRQAIRPKITAGECYFSIGMSEPDSGSDLASVRTRAEPVPGGFRVNGTKVWNSGAHHNHYCITLVRTSGPHGDRHKGLSQLLDDLKTPGITIRPIINLAGRHDWNEVTFSDTFIPDSCLIGNDGVGWLQVTSELAFERLGPERFMQNFYILRELVRVLGRQPAKRASAILGRVIARQWTLRQMSVAVAGMMQGGKSPAIEAALVKDLGTIYQQDLPEIARVLAESDATTEDDMADFLDVAQYATMMAPSYTIQGGTTQVLRGIVARGLGMR